MPSSKSAAKRDRQNEKKRLANKARKTELKTIAKKLLRAVHDGHADEAQTIYRRYAKRVDQAAAKGVLHSNAASRHKSRMAIRLKSAAA